MIVFDNLFAMMLFYRKRKEGAVMTAQIADSYSYQNKEYRIVAASAKISFDLQK